MRMGTMYRLTAVVVAVMLVALMAVTIAGCRDEQPAEVDYEDPIEMPEDVEPEANANDAENADDAAEHENEDAEAAEEDAVTIINIETERGTMVAELYDEKMPITAGSFLLLVDDGFYDDLTFHRVVPDFVIQGGDPAGDGTGGPGFAIPMEKPGEVAHERGVLSMARSAHIDSAGSQFFVCLSDNESVRALDHLGGGYAAFGKVIEGMEFADQVAVGDRIESITIQSESPHAAAARETAAEERIQ